MSCAGEGVGESDGAGLGEGFGAGEVHSFTDVQGIGVADMGDEGHEEGQEEEEPPPKNVIASPKGAAI